MNNLIFGNDRCSYYETICGGTEPEPALTVQTACSHMTNTTITDPEILEWRFPVRLERFAIRQDSGGTGKNNGGSRLFVVVLPNRYPFRCSRKTGLRDRTAWTAAREPEAGGRLSNGENIGWEPPCRNHSMPAID